jgi:predicted secreted protein
MKKQMNQFAVQTKNKVVERVGNSVIYQPKTHFKGGKQTKWFDDSQLLRKKK